MKLSALLAAFGLLCCAFGQSAGALEISSDIKSGIYPKGREVVFHIKLGEGDDLATVRRRTVVQFSCIGKLLDARAQDVEDGFTLSFTPAKAGWYVCQTLKTDPPAATPGAEAELRLMPRNALASVGVMVDPDAVGPVKPAPEDFADFWAGWKKKLADQELQVKLTPVSEQQVKDLGDWQTRGSAEARKAGVQVFNFDIDVLPDIRSAKGFFALPPNAAPKSCPAIVNFQAAGLEAFWCRGDLVTVTRQAQKYNALAFDINANGIMLGRPAEYYKEQGADPQLILGMSLRMIRLFDFIAARPEWNGKLICRGVSRGGGQALTAAGIDERVTAVVAIKPGMCDSGGPAGGRPAGHMMWRGKNMHFDNIYLSAGNHADTLVFCGLCDMICPSPGILAAFNAVPHERKKIHMYPHEKHQATGLDAWIGDMNKMGEAWIAGHLAEPAPE